MNEHTGVCVYFQVPVCRVSEVKAPTGELRELLLTEALRLEQVGLLNADMAAPGQEVGGVVAGEEGPWRSAALARHLPRGKQLNGGKT